MNVPTISMDPRIAAIHYRDYRKKVRQYREERLAAAAKKIHDGNATMRQGRAERSQVEKEDETLMLSYREMARGQRILNLPEVLRKAGLQEKNKLPVLAVAQAHWKYAHLFNNTYRDPHHVLFAEKSYPDWSNHAHRWKDAISVPRSVFSEELYDNSWRSSGGRSYPSSANQRAMVPSIPVQLRPAGSLADYTILWEAVWESHVPVDPLLLKHVSGGIYTVLAQWDLTPIERAVLEGRLS